LISEGRGDQGDLCWGGQYPLLTGGGLAKKKGVQNSSTPSRENPTRRKRATPQKSLSIGEGESHRLPAFCIFWQGNHDGYHRSNTEFGGRGSCRGLDNCLPKKTHGPSWEAEAFCLLTLSRSAAGGRKKGKKSKRVVASLKKEGSQATKMSRIQKAPPEGVGEKKNQG